MPANEADTAQPAQNSEKPEEKPENIKNLL